MYTDLRLPALKVDSGSHKFTLHPLYNKLYTINVTYHCASDYSFHCTIHVLEAIIQPKSVVNIPHVNIMKCVYCIYIVHVQYITLREQYHIWNLQYIVPLKMYISLYVYGTFIILFCWIVCFNTFLIQLKYIIFNVYSTHSFHFSYYNARTKSMYMFHNCKFISDRDTISANQREKSNSILPFLFVYLFCPLYSLPIRIH